MSYVQSNPSNVKHKHIKHTFARYTLQLFLASWWFAFYFFNHLWQAIQQCTVFSATTASRHSCLCPCACVHVINQHSKSLQSPQKIEGESVHHWWSWGTSGIGIINKSTVQRQKAVANHLANLFRAGCSQEQIVPQSKPSRQDSWRVVHKGVLPVLTKVYFS